MTKIFAISLLFCLTLSGILSICPDQIEKIKPCVCEDNSIYCTGNYDINLENIFDTLNRTLSKSSKYFNRFLLRNTAIKELKENTFKEIKFEEIHIGFCDNLTTIHKNTFKGTDLFTTKLEIFDCPALTSPDNSIFEALSKFVAIENIKISNVNITEIPSNAFKTLNGHQNNLTQLYFTGKSFEKLGSNAFFTLNNLRVLSFEEIGFGNIPENAFAFESDSNLTLVLNFASNKIMNFSSVFSHKSLANIKRPTKLLFGSSRYPKEITYLTENVFSPFLLDNQKNTIDLFGEAFDCSDCRNNWIRKRQQFLSQLTHLSCSNGRQFNDPDNFKKC